MTRGPSPPGAYCGGKYNLPIKTYLCPSDPSYQNGMSLTTNGAADHYAASCYAANSLAFGNPYGANDALRCQGIVSLTRSFPDGLSNTVFFGETYASCGTHGPATAAGSLWADSTLPWRPIMCHNTPDKSLLHGYPPCYSFQIQPRYFETCDSSQATQTGHASGMNVGLGDGSVRIVSPVVTLPLGPRAATPRDGVTLGSDW